jgi:glycopeptide antibiotics resistance protein
VLLLLPFGVAAGYALRRLWPVVGLGVVAALLIEATQGWLGNGSCQGDDVVRNIAGAVLGAGIGVALGHVYGGARTDER